MDQIRHKVAIVGAAETDDLGTDAGHMSRLALHARGRQATRSMTPACHLADVDGLLCAGAIPNEVAEYLGIQPRYIDGTSVGGCSFMIHVRHAVAAIMAGYCDVALDHPRRKRTLRRRRPARRLGLLSGRPVRGPLRDRRRADDLLDPRPASLPRVRHDQGAPRAHRRSDPRLGQPQPDGDDGQPPPSAGARRRADHPAGCAQLADDLLPVQPARLLCRRRRRRSARARLRGARQGLRQGSGLRARRRRSGGPLDGLADARPHHGRRLPNRRRGRLQERRSRARRTSTTACSTTHSPSLR